MSMAKADALFARGMWREAAQLRQEALSTMGSDPRRWAAEIIGLDGKSGARFRVAGNFAAALAANQDSMHAHAADFNSGAYRSRCA